MNIKEAAQVIRDSVTMEQILSLYGYKTKRGFMKCPFHDEKTASLKVYENRRMALLRMRARRKCD